MSEETVVIPGTLQKDLTYTGKKYEPGTKFTYHTYLAPAALKSGKNLALYVLLEHTPEIVCPFLSAFMDEGLMPPGLVLFFYPGILEPTLPKGLPRGMRTEEFDEYNRDFSDFMVEELIPHAAKTAGAVLDQSPDMHFITGGSSGGTLAWNAVWFRNDYFRRAFLSSPTFAAERGGEETLTIVRKSEARPIRIYMTAGTEEPAGVDGSSLYAALNAADTFEFAGYDFRYEQFNGEGHCCRRQDSTLWRRIVTFLWANWQSDPTVRPLFNQRRISQLLEPGSRWEIYNGTMPEKKPVRTGKGTYTFSGGKIFLGTKNNRRVVASGFGRITAIVRSTDRWRLYIADSTRRYLFAMSIMPDGSLAQCCKLAPLYLHHDCRITGAKDITVLPDNRVVAATELGVQGVWCTGMIDLILPLPGDVPAEQIAYQDGMLYVSSGRTVYRRKLRTVPVDVPGYSIRSHLIP